MLQASSKDAGNGLWHVALLYRYWMTPMDEKRSTGNWGGRQYLAVYAPELQRPSDGGVAIAGPADDLPRHD